VTAEPSDPLAIAALVCAIFDFLGRSYSIGGSIASSMSGEPRSTLDVDIVASFDLSHVDALVDALQAEFYVERAAIERAVRDRSSANAIHRESSVKIDLFVAGGTPLDDDVLKRRIAVTPAGAGRRLYVHSPEDILLQKLRWYRRGGDVSDRQWRDALGIVRVQRTRLDQPYLTDGATRLGIRDLLDRVLREASSPGSAEP
jgi:hypothetical protein